MNDNITQPIIKLKEMIKVHLTRETPWAEVIELNLNGFIGKISNKLLHEYNEFERKKWTKDVIGDIKDLPQLHNYKQNDLVQFTWELLKDGRWVWEAKEIMADEITISIEDLMQAIIELYHICATCGNGFMEEEAKAILDKFGMNVEPQTTN